jgi:hypothetical protein
MNDPTGAASLFALDPVAYAPSVLHHPGRTFPETNCYTDIWIELLHALGSNPVSSLAFTVAIDFEGDQWTFIKPPPEDLEALYGIDVHEMQFYRPAAAHILEQLAQGRTVIIEADSFYLPDTAAISYRQAHVKSSIAIESIDVTGQRLRYFHGAGYHELSDQDFRGVLRLGRSFSDDVLPPYVEIVRFDAGPRLKGDRLREEARTLLKRHLARRPRHNPWIKFGERLSRDLSCLLSGTPETYHAYAFATVRQCGAAFDLAKDFVQWLLSDDEYGEIAARAFERQVQNAKALLFRLARRRTFDAASDIRLLAEDWDAAMHALECASERAAVQTA